MDFIRRCTQCTLHSCIFDAYRNQRNYHRERFAARKLFCSGLMIIKQSTRHYNTGNLLEKRASAGNYDAPSSSAYVGSERSRREINEIPFARTGAARYNASRLVGSIGQRRGCERRVNFRLSLSLALSSSLFAAEGSYYGVISTPSGHLPPPRHIAVLNSHIVTLCDPGEVQSRTHSGGGYCNFYRWTGVCALTREKNELYEMTRPIAQGTSEPREYIHVDIDINIYIYISYIHVSIYTYVCTYPIGMYGWCPTGTWSTFVVCTSFFYARGEYTTRGVIQLNPLRLQGVNQLQFRVRDPC